MADKERDSASLVILKTEVKTTARHHCTPPSVAKIKLDRTKHGWRYGATAAPALPVSVSVETVPLESNLPSSGEAGRERRQG